MQAKVFGGSFGAVDCANINIGWDGKLKSIELRAGKSIHLTFLPIHITSANILSEQDKKSFIRKVAGGAIGGLALGGAGLLAGALASGNKRSTLVLVGFVDGRSCAMEMDDKGFKALLACSKF